ncbi:hypothetical protein BDW22DRAFT_1455275 [Trametopsis cervina]|nr:hypothetical protein BDW22DRAFT_1455275 [Trametopsis cervina]
MLPIVLYDLPTWQDQYPRFTPTMQTTPPPIPGMPPGIYPPYPAPDTPELILPAFGPPASPPSSPNPELGPDDTLFHEAILGRRQESMGTDEMRNDTLTPRGGRPRVRHHRKHTSNEYVTDDRALQDGRNTPQARVHNHNLHQYARGSAFINDTNRPVTPTIQTVTVRNFESRPLRSRLLTLYVAYKLRENLKTHALIHVRNDADYAIKLPFRLAHVAGFLRDHVAFWAIQEDGVGVAAFLLFVNNEWVDLTSGEAFAKDILGPSHYNLYSLVDPNADLEEL